MRGILIAFILLLVSPTAAHAADDEVIYAVGDSITQGDSAPHEWQSWPSRIGALKEGRTGGCLVVPKCWKTQEPMIATYHDKVLTKRPDVVILAYGINDLVTGVVSPRDIADAMHRIERRNDRRGIATYIATLTPTKEVLFGMVGRQRVELNRLIRTEFKGRVLFFSRLLTDPTNGLLADEYDSGDGLHPNALAYRLMAREAALRLRHDGHMVRLPRR